MITIHPNVLTLTNHTCNNLLPKKFTAWGLRDWKLGFQREFCRIQVNPKTEENTQCFQWSTELKVSFGSDSWFNRKQSNISFITKLKKKSI